MQRIVLRSATSEDLDSLRRFQAGVIDAERPFDPTLQEGNIAYYDIPWLIAADHVQFLVAQIDEELVGCGFARIDSSKPYLKHAEHAYLGLMFVVPRYRGLGINGRILEGLKQWCRERNVAELRLEVYHGNQAAVNAYAKAGFTAHIVEMRMALES